MSRHIVKWVLVGLILVGPIGLSGGAAAATSSQDSAQQGDTAESGAKQAAAVVAHFHLSGALLETPMDDPFGLMGGQVSSLKGLLKRLARAREDEKVRAVVLTFGGMSMGWGQLEEVRGALTAIREGGKPVHVHIEGMSTGMYALLSAATEVAMVPHSSLWLTGLYGESLYAKGLLDKIGVDADFMHMGAYKSAAEMLTRTGPSPEAEENVNWLLDSMYESMVKMIASSRGMSGKKVREMIDGGPYTAERARTLGLIDAVKYRDEFLADITKAYGAEARIVNKYGRDKGPKINFASPLAIFSLIAEIFQQKKPTKDAVGVVYVDGMILTGHSQPSPFGGSSGAYSGDIRKALEKAASDPLVKAVVLRVDSPGGSAEASEIILHATRKVQAKKPLIVSMGNVAGSGGYYVSCGADRIFADETTITASIGVVGGKLITTGMWEKLGINWVGYRRGAQADIFSSARRFNEQQKVRLENYMREIYVVFKDHVTKGRGKKLRKPLEAMAGGRVYTGRQAVELGLVDEIGGYARAVKFAAAQAGMEDYEVRVIPEPKDFFMQLMESLSGEDSESPTDLALGLAGITGGVDSSWYGALPSGLKQLDPQRMKALQNALLRIELIRRENVVMMMPYELVLH